MDLLTMMLAERVSSFIKDYKKNKRKDLKDRDRRIMDALIRLRTVPTVRSHEFFSLHKNPYFIQDLADPPHNSFKYSLVRHVEEREEDPFIYREGRD